MPRKKYDTPHRSRVVKTRMTEEEYADFAARLAPYGISQSEFIRRAIQGASIRPVVTVSPVNDELLAALGKLTAEYGRIGSNLNQIARAINDWHNPYPQLAAEVRAAASDLAAKEAGNMVDLDNDPTKLIEIVEIGKQLLMTRGTLTTFSIANDVAKYFAIVPALFMVAIPELAALNIMQLHSPESAILSAVIFNAIIIPILIPLALRGVQYKPIGASALLRRNLLIYGVGGVIAPFIGIKLIDLLVGLFF